MEDKKIKEFLQEANLLKINDNIENQLENTNN